MEKWNKDRELALKRGYTSLPESEWGVNFDSLTQEDHVRRVRAWNPKMEKGGFLYGLPGRGKSALGKALINQWASEDYRALFITVGDVLDNIRNAFDDKETTVGQEMARLLAPDFLFLDDLGTEKQSDFTNDKFFSIVNERMRSKKHTWFSTNLTLDEFEKQYEPRIFDRLFAMCSFIECKGPSYRRRSFSNEI